MKKRGFGEGKWNGVGGKLEDGETIEAAAVREADEEIGVYIELADLTKVAEFDFNFKDNPDFDQCVHVYMTTKWSGEPSESEEMRPQWYKTDSLPFKDMWIDDQHWLPKLIAGQKLSGTFIFSGDGSKLLDMQMGKLS